MHIGKVASEVIYRQTGARPLMYPYHFGSFVELCCSCFSRCFKANGKYLTDSIEFYTKRESDLKVRIGECRERVLTRPLDILFVTFEEQKMAHAFLRDYRLGFFGQLLKNACGNNTTLANCYLCHELPKDSILSKQLRANTWYVKYAPAPNNIKWENISKIGSLWWFRCILINVILIILMIFFTTPSILLEKVFVFVLVLLFHCDFVCFDFVCLFSRRSFRQTQFSTPLSLR